MIKYLGFIWSFLLFTSIAAIANVRKVGTNQSVHSIQQAINASQNGDTILVDAGIYKEKNITVNKSITLIGNDYPVLDGEHKYEIISVRANGVTINGFKLMHSGVSSITDIAGIKIYENKNVVVSGNILEDTFFGIYLQKATDCLVENNKLTAYATH